MQIFVRFRTQTVCYICTIFDKKHSIINLCNTFKFKPFEQYLLEIEGEQTDNSHEFLYTFLENLDAKYFII